MIYIDLPRLAVYDDTRIIEKYHHTLATSRPDIDLKTKWIIQGHFRRVEYSV